MQGPDEFSAACALTAIIKTCFPSKQLGGLPDWPDAGLTDRQDWSYCPALPAGTLPLRVSPSKTPVRIDSRRNHDARPVAAPMASVPGLTMGMGIGMGMAGMPEAGSAPLSHPQLPPALLVAMAGLHMYPGSYPPH